MASHKDWLDQIDDEIKVLQKMREKLQRDSDSEVPPALVDELKHDYRSTGAVVARRARWNCE
jgi:hypothetical protein